MAAAHRSAVTVKEGGEGGRPVLLRAVVGDRASETEAFKEFEDAFEELKKIHPAEVRRRYPNIAWIIEDYRRYRHTPRAGRPRSLRTWWRRHVYRPDSNYAAIRGRPPLLAEATAADRRRLVRRALTEARRANPKDPYDVLVKALKTAFEEALRVNGSTPNFCLTRAELREIAMPRGRASTRAAVAAANPSSRL